ncbi:MAG: MucB/RseB C-terminal domain-containing protein [Pseudomonadota bacterium]
MRNALLVLMALVALAPVSARADATEVSVWLDKMARALREENYQGIFTYMRGYQLDTVKIVHRYRDNTETERLVHLNGDEREMIREGDVVTCRHSPDASIDIEHEVPLGPFTHRFNENLANFQALYDFEMLGEDRVAARPAVKIGITPRHDDRWGYRLWLDRETGLLLQSHLVGRGQILEVFQFSEVTIGGPIAASDLASSLGGDAVTHRLSPTETVASPEQGVAPAWRVAWLPNGFRQVRVRSPNRIMYSDGIATLSVFVERGSGKQLGELVTHMGGTVVLTRRLKGSAQQITVVGEVPTDTAKKVAESVEPVLY